MAKQKGLFEDKQASACRYSDGGKMRFMPISYSIFLVFYCISPAHSQQPEPPGSYRESCQNCNVYADSQGREFLNCECKTGKLDFFRESIWKKSSVNITDCPRGMAGNNHGQLVCE